MPYKIHLLDKIWIYGYNKRGRKLSEKLSKQGIIIKGFVDKNAIIYKKENVKNIILPTELVFDNSLIIIAMENALIHEEVADYLADLGYNKIIYLPTKLLVDREKAMIMRNIYNEILSYGINADIFDIPYYYEMKPNNSKRYNGIIQESENQVIFWAHVELLYINNICLKDSLHGLEYYGKSLCIAEHYIELFKFMQFGNKNDLIFKKYCDAQEYKWNDKEIIPIEIKDRYKLYYFYKRELNQGMDFFISSAPYVEPNTVGGLNIKDGLHRSIFLLLQNFSYIPVRIDKMVFFNYYKYDDYNEIIDYMNINNIYKTVTPISHPGFYLYQADKEIMEKSVLTYIKEWIGLRDIDNKNILDISDYNSYFARNMHRMQKQPNTIFIDSVELDYNKKKFAELLNNLLHTNEVNIYSIEQFNWSKKYNLIFIMDILNNIINKDWLISQLSMCCEGVIIWQSSEINIDLEIKELQKNIAFKYYKSICQYFNGNQVIEVGIFSTDKKLRI